MLRIPSYFKSAMMGKENGWYLEKVFLGFINVKTFPKENYCATVTH